MGSRANMRSFLEFKRMKTPKGKKMPRWKVMHVAEEYSHLGMIEWCGAWWQFVFKPCDDTFYSMGCMEEIADFLRRVNRIQREKWRNK